MRSVWPLAGHLPGDKSLVCRVNSFAQLPAFGGKVGKIALQRGYRAPEVPPFEKGANSGPRLAATDPGAALTVPGAGDVEQPGGTGDSVAPVRKNAEV